MVGLLIFLAIASETDTQSIEPQIPGCQTPLGMEDGSITNKQIATSLTRVRTMRLFSWGTAFSKFN